jgi:protein TonB
MVQRNTGISDMDASGFPFASVAVGAGLDASSAARPWLHAREPRARRLFVTIFAASIAAHAALALRLKASGSDRTARPPSKVEVEILRPPPPPVVTPPRPLEEAPPVAKSTPRTASPRPTEKPVTSPPRPSTAGVPEGPEGTAPPIGDPEPIISAPAATPVVVPQVAPPPPAPPAVVAAKEGANYLRNPRPAYPRIAKREGWQGLVTLRVRVLPNGHAETVSVLGPSGRSILDEAAVEAVKEWTFVPASQGGQPIAGWVTVPIDFRLQ